MVLSNIRVVLVGTTHPGNIGAAARAMKTMGLRRLYLVAPQHFPSAEATARASGADDVLYEARVCGGLAEATDQCALVFGASARLRSLAWPFLDARGAAASAVAQAATAQVAMVFGRERTGLTNQELAGCHYLLHIPTDPEYNSLNLAAAVQLVAYEVRMAALASEITNASPQSVTRAGEAPATVQQMEGFYAHLEQALMDIGFLDPANPGRLMARMRRLFARARVQQTEVNILRGVLGAAQRLGRSDNRGPRKRES